MDFECRRSPRSRWRRCRAARGGVGGWRPPVRGVGVTLSRPRRWRRAANDNDTFCGALRRLRIAGHRRGCGDRGRNPWSDRRWRRGSGGRHVFHRARAHTLRNGIDRGKVLYNTDAGTWQCPLSLTTRVTTSSTAARVIGSPHHTPTFQSQPARMEENRIYVAVAVYGRVIASWRLLPCCGSVVYLRRATIFESLSRWGKRI